jgi:hypothetical protein
MCKRHGIDPWSYLAAVLTRLSSHPAERIAELLPDVWAQTQRTTSERDHIPTAHPNYDRDQQYKPLVMGTVFSRTLTRGVRREYPAAGAAAGGRHPVTGR